jgi:biopolymer transport protein TolR
MALSTGARGRGGLHEINVTPLVDVMLVLLVVFMVTAPLLATGLKVELPRVDAANTPVPDQQVVLSITRDEKMFLGEREVTATLADALRTDPALAAKHALYVRADASVRYAAVARAVAAAKAAGITALNLMVDPQLAKP